MTHPPVAYLPQRERVNWFEADKFKMKSLAALALSAVPALAQTQLCTNGDELSENGYYFRVNRWYEGGDSWECLDIHSVETTGVDFGHFWEYGSGMDPNTYVAYNHAGRELGDDVKLVSSVKDIPSSAEWWIDPSWNAWSAVSYDLYTSSDKKVSPRSGDYEVIITYVPLSNLY